MVEKIGIYGGSFNPIHFGHIHLAIDMLEMRNLEKILFCPAALNPHKMESKELVASEHRLAMLKLAIMDIPQFSILESELKRPSPSYTIDTINELLANDEPFVNESHDDQKQKNHYFLIVGDDTVENFHHWHKAHELIEKVEVLVGVRSEKCFDAMTNLDPLIDEALKVGRTLTRIFEVSSTEIRNRIAAEKYCGHLVPAKVLDYIYRNRLYC
ncbi:MAG: nicotinate (nicotinamide) nucleotide adenylyltransferase [Parachlamydiaceae bacterium]|nr:nicotinate (nicotinamide) nucleotide adenylyltransferase [Parachlamydiaceae bacterium]